MNTSYRTAPPVAPQTLIAYRPRGIVRPLWTSSALTCVLVGMASSVGLGLGGRGLFTLIFAVPSIFMVHRIWERALLRFDWASRRVIVERSRWPLRSTSRSFSLDEVTGAEVLETPATPLLARQYHVVLTLASGERVPLASGSSNVRAHHDRIAAEILSALGRKEGSLHGRSEGGPRRLG